MRESGDLLDVSRYLSPENNEGYIFQVKDSGDHLEFSLSHPEEYLHSSCSCQSIQGRSPGNQAIIIGSEKDY